MEEYRKLTSCIVYSIHQPMCARLVRLVEWQMLLMLEQSQGMQVPLMDYIPGSKSDT